MYAVQSYIGRRWVVRRFARLADARRFRDREVARLRIGLDVCRVNADLSTDRLTRDGEWKRM